MRWCLAAVVAAVVMAVAEAHIAWDLEEGKWCKQGKKTVSCEPPHEGIGLLDDLAVMHHTDKGTDGHGYTLIYEPMLERFRHKKFVLLEIGCHRGGSARTWADYFANAETVCIDMHPNALKIKEVYDNIHVFIANQGNETDLHELMKRMPGPPDIIIDDGSHLSRHIITSYKTLYPYLNMNGLYIIEDMGTQYHPAYVGNGCNEYTAMQFVKGLMDYVMMSTVCEVPKEPWQLYIKDIHLYGAGGMAVIHKGRWTPFEGKTPGVTWSPDKPFGPQKLDAVFGSTDQQFLAWDGENIDEEIVQAGEKENLLITPERNFVPKE